MTQADPRLDWIGGRHDPRSVEDYHIRGIIREAVEPRKRVWSLGAGLPLNQGNEGACVGFGWSGRLSTSPVRVKNVDNAFARGLYQQAKTLDEWEGEAYEGTSVLAGAKACVARGDVREYRWCTSTEDVRDSVVSLGPVVLGINWFDGMYETRPSGLVEVNGSIVGGHCIMVYGYNPKMRIVGENWLQRHEVFYWMNSWGDDYGKRGRGLIHLDDLDKLLAAHGEACIPTEVAA